MKYIKKYNENNIFSGLGKSINDIENEKARASMQAAELLNKNLPDGASLFQANPRSTTIESVITDWSLLIDEDFPIYDIISSVKLYISPDDSFMKIFINGKIHEHLNVHQHMLSRGTDNFWIRNGILVYNDHGYGEPGQNTHLNVNEVLNDYKDEIKNVQKFLIDIIDECESGRDITENKRDIERIFNIITDDEECIEHTFEIDRDNHRIIAHLNYDVPIKMLSNVNNREIIFHVDEKYQKFNSRIVEITKRLQLQINDRATLQVEVSNDSKIKLTAMIEKASPN